MLVRQLEEIALSTQFYVYEIADKQPFYGETLFTEPTWLRKNVRLNIVFFFSRVSFPMLAYFGCFINQHSLQKMLADRQTGLQGRVLPSFLYLLPV